MGKKRIITKGETETKTEGAPKAAVKLAKKRVDSGKLYVQSTYNNTLVSVSDRQGNVLMSSSSGALGFRGAKKGTPFAASKIAEALGQIAEKMGIKKIHIVVKGIGSGRESALRSIANQGFEIGSIKDVTPIPHNGCKPKKPRRL